MGQDRSLVTSAPPRHPGLDPLATSPTPASDMGRTEPEDCLARAEGAGAPSRLSLIVQHAGEIKAAILAPGRPVVVGRCPPAELWIPEKTLSRRHARFTLRDGRIHVDDLGSTNGTWIGGQRIHHGEIDAGETVRIAGLFACVHELSAPLPALTREEADTDSPLFASPRMLDLLETARRVAVSRVPVILHGETGTGKEVLARLLHDSGPRRGRRMVRVNCGAIPASLAESALFGHEKGSFTGAAHQQKGVFEEADRGTLFLDEIGELPLSAQAMLLRVLETGSFCRVGSSREIHVDVRIVAATHRDLEAMAAEASFRADLYYRLGTVTLEIPPLRERRDEIGPLAMHFLRRANAGNGRGVRRIAPDALERIVAYPWPGNVRELRNAIERAVVVSDGDSIALGDLPPRVQRASEAPTSPAPPSARTTPTRAWPSGGGELDSDYRRHMREHEVRLIHETMNATGWNRAEAARRLNMPLRTLAYKIKVHGLRKPGS